MTALPQGLIKAPSESAQTDAYLVPLSYATPNGMIEKVAHWFRRHQANYIKVSRLDATRIVYAQEGQRWQVMLPDGRHLKNLNCVDAFKALAKLPENQPGPCVGEPEFHCLP